MAPEPASERLRVLEKQIAALVVIFDNLDLSDPSQVREIAETVRWIHERRLARAANRSTAAKYLATFVGALAASVAGAYILDVLHLRK